MRKPLGIALLCVMAVASAACAPVYVQPPRLPEDAITFRMGYPRAFDLILRTLEADGYEIAVADRERGFIETRPKAVKPAPAGDFDHKTFVTIRVGGGWRESWAVVNLVVLSGYPKERERLIERLQGERKPSDD